MMSELDEEIAKELHNNQVRKNLKKFAETGILTDNNGNKLDLESTVNYTRINGSRNNDE